METFYLQNESGLFLTNQGNSVKLEKQDFSKNQTWYWSGDMIMCGTGKVLDSQYGSISVTSPDDEKMCLKFYFHPIEDDKFYIAKYEDKDKKIEENDEPQIFFGITEEGAFMSEIEDSKVPFTWRQVSTDQAYKWVMMDSEKVPERAFEAGRKNLFVGRGDLNGELHIGKVDGETRSIGVHDEDKMATEAFYLQSESGLYLTNADSQMLTLAELDFSPNQIWYLKKSSGEAKNMLMCGSGYFCKMQGEAKGSPVFAAEAWSDDDLFFNNFQKVDDDKMLFGRFVEGNSSETFFGFNKNGEGIPMMEELSNSDMQFKWKNVPTNQAYQWVAMDSKELPENALDAAKDDASSVFVGLGEVNGKIHPGNVRDGIRKFGYECLDKFGKKDHCNHCCTGWMGGCSSIATVTTEKFSVLCVEPDAEVEWIECPDLEHPTRAYHCDYSKFPMGAVVAGVTSGWLYYVGRAKVGDQIVPGIFKPKYSNTKLAAFHDGKMQDFKEFEMLVVRKKGGENVKTNVDKVQNENHYFGIDNMEKTVTSENFSVLCAHPNAEFEWVEYKDKKLPNGAVIGGIFAGGIYYVGRGIIQNQDNPGMFLHQGISEKRNEVLEHTLYAPYGGEMVQLKEFEVLVVTKNVEEEWKLIEADEVPKEDEEWKLIRAGVVPKGFGIVKIDETNFSEYSEIMKSLIIKAVEDGTIWIARKIDLTFKKVPVGSDGRIATVAEVRENKEKVMPLMAQWTIALLDGGKVDGYGYGSQIQEGDFQEQCGEKIIAERSDAIREMKATVQEKAILEAPPAKKEEDPLGDLGGFCGVEKVRESFCGVGKVREAAKKEEDPLGDLGGLLGALGGGALGAKKEEDPLGDLGGLLGALGGLMTAFAPKEDAEQLQEQVNQMAEMLSPLKIVPSEPMEFTEDSPKISTGAEEEVVAEEVKDDLKIAEATKEDEKPEDDLGSNEPTKEVEKSEDDSESAELTKEVVEKAFAKADTEGTGKLTKNQLKIALLEILESGSDAAFISDKDMINDDEVLRLFTEVADRDGDKLINLNELLIILELGDEKLDQKEMFTKLVKAADKDKNGFLSAAELKNLVVKMKFEDEDEVDGMVKMFMVMGDTDGDKKLKLEEVVSLFSDGPKEEDPKEEMKRMFRMYDTNDDGFISKKEMIGYMNFMGFVDEDDTPAEMRMIVNMMMADADKDGDGKLNYDEFCAMMN